MVEQVGPFYKKDLKCPLCANKYTSTKIRSRFVKVKKVHSDFFTEYEDPHINPSLYEVFVCPTCGYAHSDSFSTSFPPNTENIIKEQLKNWDARDFGNKRSLEDAIETYKFGLLSGTLKKEKNIVIAGLCMRLAWLYRLTGNDEQDQRYVRTALKQYEAAYQQSDFEGTKMPEIRILYIIGELHRRTGDLKQAIKYFSLVTSHKSKEIETKIVGMARGQWELVREESKK